MIYIGTFLLSVLSFFTTYYGLTILVDVPLAIIGSLGLQVAMLGIAWNLMKIRENKATYVTVFLVAASFSIMFSYANFDSNLKKSVRQTSARADYNSEARPILAGYAATADEAAHKGRYQVERLGRLLDMEQKRGWATAVDEGSGDPFLQSVIDGARNAVASWKEQKGAEYHQGAGSGIIASYLESRLNQAGENLSLINNYSKTVDSISLMFNSELPVARQYDLANAAFVMFPSSEAAMLASTEIKLPQPPSMADFVEVPVSQQHAFKLVIQDLVEMDRLALFSLLLAIAIDLIVILMAFAGSLRVEDVDSLFDRIRHDTALRIKNLSLDDTEHLSAVLDDNLNRFRKANRYGLDVIKLLGDYRNDKKKFRISLHRESESITRTDERFSGLRQWTSRLLRRPVPVGGSVSEDSGSEIKADASKGQ